MSTDRVIKVDPMTFYASGPACGRVPRRELHVREAGVLPPAARYRGTASDADRSVPCEIVIGPRMMGGRQRRILLCALGAGIVPVGCTVEVCIDAVVLPAVIPSDIAVSAESLVVAAAGTRAVT